MVASSDDARSTASGDRRKSARDARSAPAGDRRKPARTRQYMIAPAGPGVSGQELADQLNQFVQSFGAKAVVIAQFTAQA